MLSAITPIPQRVVDVLERAEGLHVEKGFDISKQEYVVTTKLPCSLSGYQSEVEPIVPPDPFEIGSATLTVNCYNALVLNSPDLFIADIDQGDPRFSNFATGTDVDEILTALGDLASFDDYMRSELRYWSDGVPGLSFASASWRIYRTYAGFRVICTSQPYSTGQDSQECLDMFPAKCLLRFLRADPRYIEMCAQQQCFRARLTRKPWREDHEHRVCYRIETIGEEVHPSLAGQLELHDELTSVQWEW